MANTWDERFLEVAVALGLLARPDAEAVLHWKVQTRDPRSAGELLVARGLLRPEDLARVHEHAQLSGSRSADVPRPDEPRIGPYRVLGELGRGGMGVVLRVAHPMLRRELALKLLDGAHTGDADLVARFKREARSAGRLRHPGIVAVHDGGQDERGRPWFTMEIVRGPSLKQAIAPGPLPAARTAEIGEQVALALGYAHQEGVLHRDLKPENILLECGGGDLERARQQGRPLIADFGLAKDTRSFGLSDARTRAGEALGTPVYMAPERARGEAGDGRTDVYGLGAVLYEVLTGSPPFEGDDATEVFKTIQRKPPRPPSRLARVPAELEQIVLRCLAKDPGARYLRAEDLAADLGRFRRGEPIDASATAAHAALQAGSANQATVLALVAATMVSSALAAIGLRSSFVERRGRQEAETRATEATAQADAARALAQAMSAAARGARADEVQSLVNRALAAGRDPVTLEAAAAALADAGDTSGAVALLDEAAKSPDSALSALVALNELALRTRPSHMKPVTLERLEKAAAGRDTPLASFARALAALARNELDKAGGLLDRAVGAAPAFVPARAERGVVRARRGDLRGAREDLDASAVLAPKRTRTLLARAELRFAGGDVTGAEDDATRALALAPDDPGLLILRAQVRGRLDPVAGIGDADRAISLEDSVVSRIVRSRLKARNLDEKGALEDAERALTLDPSSFEALECKATALAEVDPRTALGLFARLLEKEPRRASLWAHRAAARGLVEGFRGRFEDAERALALDPRSPEGLTERGTARQEGGDHAGAVQDLDRALQVDPWNVNARVQHGVSLIQRGDFRGALLDVEPVLQRFPSHTSALTVRAWANYRLGTNAAQVVSDLDTAIAKNPTSSVALGMRVDIRCRLGDFDGARADLAALERIVGADTPLYKEAHATFEKLAGAKKK